jgi:glycerol uptake facilitator-like aquaporin
MVLDKRTTPIDAVGYILSQIIGAIFAASHRAVASASRR